MAITADVLRLRILLCFLKSAPENCTVMGIARTLNEEKHKISRAIIALGEEGLVDRSDNRAPFLTERGRAVAQQYDDRTNIALSHLLYEGVDLESAKQDAYFWALYNSEKTMDVIRSSEEQYRVKYELRDQPMFSGATLCKKLKDGCYQFPFIIYRERVKDSTNLSMAKKASVHAFIMTLPQGYDTPVGELGDTLSGGERQRLGLARAFLHDAPLMLLDEPTSNLDSLNEAVILKSLHQERGDKTVVLVSHRKSTMRIVDKVYSVEHGRMS